MTLRGTTSRLYHPRIYRGLETTGRFKSTVQIQKSTVTRSESGDSTFAWGPVSGMESIPCIRIDQQPAEARTQDMIEARNLFTIILAGYFPSIKQEYRAVLDTGEVYDILGVLSDSIHMMTKLATRTVEPVGVAGL